MTPASIQEIMQPVTDLEGKFTCPCGYTTTNPRHAYQHIMQCYKWR